MFFSLRPRNRFLFLLTISNAKRSTSLTPWSSLMHRAVFFTPPLDMHGFDPRSQFFPGRRALARPLFDYVYPQWRGVLLRFFSYMAQPAFSSPVVDLFFFFSPRDRTPFLVSAPAASSQPFFALNFSPPADFKALFLLLHWILFPEFKGTRRPFFFYLSDIS